MGKRKRGGTSGCNHETNQNQLSSSSLNAMPCFSGTELLSGELVDAGDVKTISPGMDVTDSTLKLIHMQTSLENQHNDLGRSLLFKRSRHHYGNHYSRRNSGSHASASSSHRRNALLSDSGVRPSASASHGRTAILRDSGNNASASTSLRRTVLSSDPGVRASASTSHGRTCLLRDSGNDAGTSTSLGRTAFLRGQGNHASASTSLGRPAYPAFLCDNFVKLIGQSGSHSRHLTDNREMQFRRPESVRFSSMIPSSASTDVAKMVCGICDKLLRKKRYFPGHTPPSSTEFSVVAVLACGHVYHADCLEERTSVQEIQEPPCPRCMGSFRA